MYYKNESGGTNVQCLWSLFLRGVLQFIFCKMSKTFYWGLQLCFSIKSQNCKKKKKKKKN